MHPRSLIAAIRKNQKRATKIKICVTEVPKNMSPGLVDTPFRFTVSKELFDRLLAAGRLSVCQGSRERTGG